MKFLVKIVGQAPVVWHDKSEADLVATLKGRGYTIREVGEPKHFGNIEWTQHVPDASERDVTPIGPQVAPKVDA